MPTLDRNGVTIEGMRALPSLRIAVCKRRDQVYGSAARILCPPSSASFLMLEESRRIPTSPSDLDTEWYISPCHLDFSLSGSILNEEVPASIALTASAASTRPTYRPTQ